MDRGGSVAAKIKKRAADRGIFGVAIVKLVDDAVLFGLEPVDAVRALHHALAATAAQYFGADAATVIETYAASLPILVAQYAEAIKSKRSPLIVMPDGTPAIVATGTDTKH